MRVAVTLSSYRLVDFVRLNLLQIGVIFPDCPVLVCDDKSDKTDEIKALAEEHGAAFYGSSIRRGHFSGDIQSAVCGLEFAQQEGAEIMLKLSQRLVPVLPKFRNFIEDPFKDPQVNIVVPGRISASQIRLPASKWFSGFGLLTCVYAIRVGSITPQQFLKNYTDAFIHGRFSANVLVEVSIGRLLATHFKNSAHVSMDLADHKPMEPFVFLRRQQCDPLAYQRVAAMHGLEGGNYDTRELAQIEARGEYLCRPILVT